MRIGSLLALAIFSLAAIAQSPMPAQWDGEDLKFEIRTREPFQKDLSPHARDPQGGRLVFRLVEGPKWVSLSSAGVLSGTPEDADSGSTRAEVEAKGSGPGALRRIRLRIRKKNYPPVTAASNWDFKARERERSRWDLDDKRYVTDPDSDRLRFELEEKIPWIELRPSGDLRVEAGFAQIGRHSIPIRISDGTDTVQVTARITIERNPRAPVWSQKTPEFETQSREPFQVALAQYVEDKDGLPIRFSLVEGPAWIQLSRNGDLSGTPSDKDSGSERVLVRAENADQGSEQRIRIRVRVKNHAPVIRPAGWTLRVKERETESWDLDDKKRVFDEDGQRLTFEIPNPPSWLTLRPSGYLKASPSFEHIGKHSLSVVVSDSQESVPVTLNVFVERNPRPPVWKREDLRFSMQTREPFKASIASHASDPDALPVRFSIVEGPKWVKITPSGELYGQPEDSDGGRSQALIRVENGEMSADKVVRFQISVKNHPPEIVHGNWKFTVKERTTGVWDLDHKRYAFDIDGQRLSFLPGGFPEWLTLTPSGRLQAKPEFAQIGSHSFEAFVSDGELPVKAQVLVEVERNPRAPIWSPEPMVFDGKSREAFSASVADGATDLDGLKVRFAMVRGPQWLRVAPDGTLSGSPSDADGGIKSAVLRAHNGDMGSDKVIRLRISIKNHPPTVNKNAWVFVAKERLTTRWNVNQPQYVSDSDGQSVTFELKQAPEWVSLGAGGRLAVRPEYAHIGKHRLIVSVTDGEDSVDFPAMVVVQRNPRPPEWTQDYLAYRLTGGEVFQVSIASQAKDLDGLNVKFYKVSGPSWMKISPAGEVWAQPGKKRRGAYDVVVRAHNGEAGADKELAFAVEPPAPIAPEKPVAENETSTPVTRIPPAKEGRLVFPKILDPEDENRHPAAIDAIRLRQYRRVSLVAGLGLGFDSALSNFIPNQQRSIQTSFEALYRFLRNGSGFRFKFALDLVGFSQQPATRFNRTLDLGVGGVFWLSEGFDTWSLGLGWGGRYFSAWSSPASGQMTDLLSPLLALELRSGASEAGVLHLAVKLAPVLVGQEGLSADNLAYGFEADWSWPIRSGEHHLAFFLDVSAIRLTSMPSPELWSRSMLGMKMRFGALAEEN